MSSEFLDDNVDMDEAQEAEFFRQKLIETLPRLPYVTALLDTGMPVSYTAFVSSCLINRDFGDRLSPAELDDQLCAALMQSLFDDSEETYGQYAENLSPKGQKIAFEFSDMIQDRLPDDHVARREIRIVLLADVMAQLEDYLAAPDAFDETPGYDELRQRANTLVYLGSFGDMPKDWVARGVTAFNAVCDKEHIGMMVYEDAGQLGMIATAPPTPRPAGSKPRLS